MNDPLESIIHLMNNYDLCVILLLKQLLYHKTDDQQVDRVRKLISSV